MLFILVHFYADCLYLKTHQGLKHVSSLHYEASDIRIWMLTKCFRPVDVRQDRDKVAVGLQGTVAGHVIGGQRWQTIMGGSQDVLREILLDVCHQQATIPVVGHVTTIANTCYEIFQRFPRCDWIFVQINLQQILRDLEQISCYYDNRASSSSSVTLMKLNLNAMRNAGLWFLRDIILCL